MRRTSRAGMTRKINGRLTSRFHQPARVIPPPATPGVDWRRPIGIGRSEMAVMGYYRTAMATFVTNLIAYKNRLSGF